MKCLLSGNMKFLLVLAAIVGLSMAAQTRSLQSDLDDLATLIPVEEMRAVARKYLNTDAEFQQVVAYLQGSEWAQLIADVGAKPAVQDFFKYMLEAGIDLQAIIDIIHDIIAGAKPDGHAVGSRGMREFLDEIEALFPKTEFLVMLNDKMTNSKDFQEFWAKISSDKSYNLVEEVRALDEVQRIAKVLMSMGINLTQALEQIYQLFGWPPA